MQKWKIASKIRELPDPYEFKRFSPYLYFLWFFHNLGLTIVRYSYPLYWKQMWQLLQSKNDIFGIYKTHTLTRMTLAKFFLLWITDSSA